MTKLFIGMPVYNGERFIKQAIESVMNQSFADWTLFISDNSSSDLTGKIAEQYARKDARIVYYRQKTNIGAENNFKFVLEKANTEYFMWAAADDEREEDFLRVCIDKLEGDTDLGMAFTGIVNIDSSGGIKKRYPSLSRLSGPARVGTVYRYLVDPEIMGKANLIYGVYRTVFCKEVFHEIGLGDHWGADMCFNLGFRARYSVYIDDSVFFRKRITLADEKHLIDKGWQINFIPLEIYPSYFRGLVRAVRGTGYGVLTVAVGILRLFIIVPTYVMVVVGNFKPLARHYGA